MSRARSAETIAKYREVAQAVLNAIDAADNAAKAIWTACDTANQRGIAVPGYHDLMRVRSHCLQLTGEHSQARVLAEAELGLNNTTKGR